MNRTVAALIAALLAAAFMLVGTPAHAADPIPGPIDEVVGVPSQIAKSATGSPMGDVTARQMLWALRAAANNSPTPSTAVATVPKPITAPGAVARGSSAVGAAFFAGWALTDGALAIYGATTGTEPLGQACDYDEWVQGALSVMYVFSMPDCAAPIVNPNSGVLASTTITYGGNVLTLKNTVTFTVSGNTWKAACYTGGTTGQTFPASGYSYRWTGVSAAATGTLGFTASQAQCGAGPIAAYVYSSPSVDHNPFPSAVIQNSNGATVATPVVSSPNPTRTLDCRLTWPGGSTTTATGSTYTETDGLSPLSIGNVCNDAFVSKPGHGPDLLPTEIEVGSTPGGGTRSIISEQMVPEFTPDEKKGLTAGNGHGLVLSKVIGTAVTSCMTWEADCANWWEDTDEGTTPGTYRCTYGGAAIALAECGVYRHTFDSKTASPTITDPVTGESMDWSAQPNTGNSLNPGVGPGTGLSPSETCFVTGWTAVANPVDWVMVPVKCALVWAFVPRAEVVTASQTGVTDAWEGTGPGKLSSALAAWSFVPPGGGCSGLTFSWSAVFGHDLPDWNILNACPGSPLVPAATAANVVLTIGSVLGLIYALTRFFGGTVGFGGLGGRGDN